MCSTPPQISQIALSAADEFRCLLALLGALLLQSFLLLYCGPGLCPQSLERTIVSEFAQRCLARGYRKLRFSRIEKRLRVRLFRLQFDLSFFLLFSVRQLPGNPSLRRREKGT